MGLLKGFFSGFVKIHILYHAARGPIFGAWLQAELARHGYQLSPGTLYPTLHRLAKDGYLEMHPEVVGGKVRKYYTITGHGLKVLEEARAKIRELVNEVVEEK